MTDRGIIRETRKRIRAWRAWEEERKRRAEALPARPVRPRAPVQDEDEDEGAFKARKKAYETALDGWRVRQDAWEREHGDPHREWCRKTEPETGDAYLSRCVSFGAEPSRWTLLASAALVGLRPRV